MGKCGNWTYGARPPFVGTVWKTITVPAYQAKNFAEVVRLGKLDNVDSLSDIIRDWGKEPVGLDNPVKIDLVEFDRDWWHDEAVAWGEENKKTAMATAHTMGIAVGIPNVQRERPIVQLSAVGGSVLYLYGPAGWHPLGRHTVESRWFRSFVVGFLSE